MLEIVSYLTGSEPLEDVLSFVSYARDPLTRTAIVDVKHPTIPSGRVLVAFVVYGGYRVTDTEIAELVIENIKNNTGNE